MELFKLTDRDGYTQRDYPRATLWETGKTVTLVAKDNPELCTGDVVHAYKNPNLALLLNPIHANLSQPVLWRAEGEVVVEDWGKVGCFELTTVERLPLSEWYQGEAKRKRVVIAFAILCAEAVLKHFETHNPTDDRPRKAIEAAKKYLSKPSDAAAQAAARAARAAAYAAAYAAARAADAAAYAAARAADAAARAAAYAADAAARAADDVDFLALADKAVQIGEGNADI